MERLIKKYWLVDFVILLGSFGSVVKAENESVTICSCAPTWKDYWDRYIPSLTFLTATERMVFLVDSDVKKTIADTLLVAVPPTLVWRLVSKIPNLKPRATNSKLFYVEMLEHKYRGLSEQGHSYIMDSEIEAEVQVAQTIINGATDVVTNLGFDWHVHEIMAYNRLIQKDQLESANYFKLKQMNTTVNYPQDDLTLFADWYLPIYEQHGGNKTIQRFVEVIKCRYSKSNNSGLLTDKVIVSPGEFVHIWSQAAKTDLRDLAYKAFGWISEYRSQFEVSRKTFSLYNYTDVYPNASLYKPPQNWMNHGRNLTRVYSDDHVAFYYDESVSHKVTWPFKIASEAWSYVKSSYNYSGPDRILYIVLQNANALYTAKYIFSRAHSYLNKEHDNRLVLDYTELWYGLKWNNRHYRVLQDLIVEGVGKAAATVFKEIGNNPWNTMDTDFADIFTYDIYLGTGNKEDASRYFNRFSRESYLGKSGISWFLDWYYPIYTGYGRMAVLKRFLTSLHEFWPRKGTDYTKQMRRGEFVHFWSGVTGVDLTSSAIKAFGMSPKDISVLNQARVDYPMLNYTRSVTENLTQTWTEHWGGHKENLTLDYFDGHVAFYLDPSVNQSIAWLTSLISDGWKYAKATYGPIGEGPLLYIVLHGSSTEDDEDYEKNEDDEDYEKNKYDEDYEKDDYYDENEDDEDYDDYKDKDCFISRANTFSDRNFENRNVIDCGLPPNIGNNRDTVEQVETLFIVTLANLLQNSVKGVGKWPGRRMSGHLTSFYPIIAYDILIGIGRTEAAKRYAAEKLLEYETSPYDSFKTFWFRDWYYPIYKHYGGSAALNNFSVILSAHWPHENNDYLSRMNWGEWIHFWSAAVGENLLHMAYKFENWELDNYKKYLSARKNYLLNYSDVYQNANVVLPPEKSMELIRTPSRKDREKKELYLAYTDANVAIYYNSLMGQSISWPFKSLSTAWAHAKRSYGPFSHDPLLYVSLHDEPNPYHLEDCWTNSYENDSFSNRSVISCGPRYNPWDRSEHLEQVIRGVATVIRSTAGPAGNLETPDIYDIKDIIVYDLYKAIRKRIEARESLTRSISESGFNSSINWTRDWYYPIYTKYGEAQVLNKFLSLLHAHFPEGRSYPGYVEGVLSYGEYVHFWSGATGDNLTDWATRAHVRSSSNENELHEAMRDFPMVTYKAMSKTSYETLEAIVLTDQEFGHTELIFQHYVDENVNVYFDLDVDIAANWTFHFLSKSWQYTKSSYKTARETACSVLKTVLHEDKYKGCKTLLNVGKDTVNKTTTIDCGSAPSGKWSTVSHENKYQLINEYSNLIQKSAKQPDDNTPYVRKEVSKLISFDLFMAQGMFKEAYGILSKGYNETEVQSGENKFWVRDWFLPIYSKYGGVSVLSKFLALLPTHWNLRSQNTGPTTMNVGQVVHFWSAAAGESVLNVAQDTFGRGNLHRDKLNEAKKNFLFPHYSCYDCYYDRFEQSSSERNANIGLSLGFAGIVMAVVIISFYLYRKKVNTLQQQIRELTSEEIAEFFEGNLKPAGEDGNTSIESKPFNKDFELPRDRFIISFANVLGSGEFGVVLRGVLKSPSGEETVVAVKTVKPDVDVTCFKALLIELKVMCHLGQHENLASLLGAHTVNIRNREAYIVLELCEKGDLRKFLKNNRSYFTNLLPSKRLHGQEIEKSTDQCDALAVTKNEESSNYIVTDASSCNFSTLDLLEWSTQIANGMHYIASKKVIHGDLAARNVLLTSTNVAKISDFGLSRQLRNYTNYMKTSKTPVPWRWMAIESLRDMDFSVKSDTWAFGVTLHEIFSLGATPYAGWTFDHEFIPKLVAGQRLSEPEFGNEEIYSIMMDCMKITPEGRIAYEQLLVRFDTIKKRLNEQSQQDKNSLEG